MHHFWILAAGIVIFLTGMQFMEGVLRKSAGRSVKLFLRRHTANRTKAVVGGALITAILQGSSTVNMMVLAFTGAGVLPLENALAIILGSNLGTTLDSWLIASLGFSVFTASFPYAITAVAGIGEFLVKSDNRWRAVFRFFIGIGLLFIGLDMMKNSMAGVIGATWLSQLSSLPLWMYLLAGIGITAVIQSSFAMVALVLSALFAGALDFAHAAVLVLGAEVGTTLKFFVASLDGHPVKKRLALGNFLINGLTTLLVFLFIGPLTRFIRFESGMGNDLLALVAFQSVVNIISLLLFFPFLKKFATVLERLYGVQKEDTLYIQKILPTDPEVALPAFENETRHFLQHVVCYTLNSFGKEKEALAIAGPDDRFNSKGLQEQYAYIKRLHGDIHRYYLQLRVALSAPSDIDHADQMMSSVRNGMYAAKNMKDAHDDIVSLRNSSQDFKYGYYLKAKERSADFCLRLIGLSLDTSGRDKAGELHAVYNDIVSGYTEELRGLYHQAAPLQLTDTDLSTMVNFNRELYTGYKSMLLAWKELLLDKAGADQFDELPGFIR